MSALGRLANFIMRVQPGAARPSPAQQQAPTSPGSLVTTGRVIAVHAQGLDVEYNGRVVGATQATDEPMFAGNLVYIAETVNGAPVVLGTVK